MKEIMMRVKEIKQLLMQGDKKKKLSVVTKTTLYYRKCENVTKLVGAMRHLSQINKTFILPQPFYQHLCNIYMLKYIS